MMRSVDSNENMDFLIKIIDVAINNEDMFMDDMFTDNLVKYAESGKIVFELPQCDPQEGIWDGELIIHFKEEISTSEIVNNLISCTYADEFRMENNDLLRLFWHW
jgi:hypothetical protein